MDSFKLASTCRTRFELKQFAQLAAMCKGFFNGSNSFGLFRVSGTWVVLCAARMRNKRKLHACQNSSSLVTPLRRSIWRNTRNASI